MRLRKTINEKFLELYGKWCITQGFEIPDEPRFTELTTDEAFVKTGATVYKCDGRTFVVFNEKLYSIGRSNGDGDGVCDIEVCDFDNNGIMDFVYTYTYRESEVWKAEAAVFNLLNLKSTTLRMREDKIQIPENALLILEKISDSEFNVLLTEASDEDLSADITSMEGISEICKILITSDGSVGLRWFV